MAETNQPKKLRITYVKSAIGYSVRHKATIRALGLRKLNQSVIHDDYTRRARYAGEGEPSCSN